MFKESVILINTENTQVVTRWEEDEGTDGISERDKEVQTASKLVIEMEV